MIRADRTEFATAHHQGLKREDLAARFGITPQAVTRIRRELSLPLDKPRRATTRRPKVDRDDFAALAADGWTTRELCDHYKIHVDTVRRIRRERSIDNHHTGRPMTTERKAVIQGMLDDGWSHAEISRTEGAHIKTLARHFPGTAWTDQQRAAHLSALRKANPHFNRRPRTYNEAKYAAAA